MDRPIAGKHPPVPGLLNFFKVFPQRPIAFLQNAHSRWKMRESYAAIGFPFTTVLLLNISHLIGVFNLIGIIVEGFPCVCYYAHI